MEDDNKFICINTGGMNTLTLNKVYDGAIKHSYNTPPYSSVIDITDDRGDVRIFLLKWFMSVSEFRSNRLKEVGI